MKLKVKTYIIDYAKPLSHPISILHLSDIHYDKLFPFRKLEVIKEKVAEKKPDYVFVTGDLIDESCLTKNKEVISPFMDWIRDLALISPLILVLGNHDVEGKIGKGYSYWYPEEWIQELKKIPGITLLENETYEDEAILVYGFVPPFLHYEKRELDCKVLQKAFESVFREPTAKVKILLSHTPFGFTDFKLLVEKQIDLLFSGHTHGGMLPSFLPGHGGLIAPYKTLFPRRVRGLLQNKDTKIVMSGGITKLSTRSGFFAHFNGIYKMQMEEVHLQGKNEKKS